MSPRLEWAGTTAFVVFDRPAARNAIDRASMAVFRGLLEELERSERVTAVVLTGAGGRFVAGGDLKDLAQILDRASGRAMAEEMHALLEALEALPCPTIAAIDGDAHGGGVELALAADLRVLSSGARLHFRQAAMGLAPGFGGGERLARRVGPGRALLWYATAATVDAALAERTGLVEVVAPDARAAASMIANQIGELPKGSVRAIKRGLAHGPTLSPADHRRFEIELFAELWGSPEHRARVAAFLEKRSD